MLIIVKNKTKQHILVPLWMGIFFSVFVVLNLVYSYLLYEKNAEYKQSIVEYNKVIKITRGIYNAN